MIQPPAAATVNPGYRCARMRRPLGAVACVTLVALSAPATGSADVLETYGDLALRRLSPAPLVPTAVPPSVAPLDRTITSSPSRRKSGYGLRIVHYGRNGPNAIIVLEGGSFKNLKAAFRDARRLGFKTSRTRVRGHRGYLLTRHLGPTQWMLLWVEDGRIYTLATGTPRKVSLKQLRATAAGLDHLKRDYMGTPADPNSSAEGHAVTTERTVTTRVAWEAQCVVPGGSATEIRVGNAQVTLLRYQANAFTFDIAQHRIGTAPWSGTVSGTISSSAIALTIRATGTIDGMTCDSGQFSFALDRHSDGSP
jgi:hypothetical protein